MTRADKVLAGLAAQQNDGVLCDVELRTEQQTILAHKNVLAASTPYFAAMFTGGFEETSARVVEVRGVTFVGLKNVIDFIYTSEIKIQANNIDDILPTAHLLQMTDIVDECKEWMSREITKDNCFNFLQLAERYSIETVENAITDFILEHFVSISETEGFQEIPKAALCRYLSSDKLKTNMEEHSVFKAAKRWILKNNIIDRVVVSEIMRNIRFALIPPMTLSAEIMGDDLIDGNRDFRMMVAEAMTYHVDVYKQPFYDGDMNKPRGRPGMLVITNGQRVGNKYATTGHVTMDFVRVPEVDVAKQDKSIGKAAVYDSLCAISINNFLFLFGTKCDGYHPFAMRYDASNDTWIDLKAVPQATIGSKMACSEDKKEVFLIGGMLVKASTKFEFDEDNAIAKVNSYNVQQNTWSSCCDLPMALIHPAAATMHNNIYVTGGYSKRGTTVDTVYAYDIKAKLWLTKARMNHVRCKHTLDAIGEKLYAIAGAEVDSHLITPIEVYDLHTNQWTVANCNGPNVHGSSSLVIDKSIYIIGGCHSWTSRVAVYEVDKNKVTKLPKELPFSCFSGVSRLITSPKFL